MFGRVGTMLAGFGKTLAFYWFFYMTFTIVDEYVSEDPKHIYMGIAICLFGLFVFGLMLLPQVWDGRAALLYNFENGALGRVVSAVLDSLCKTTEIILYLASLALVFTLEGQDITSINSYKEWTVPGLIATGVLTYVLFLALDIKYFGSKLKTTTTIN